MAKLAAHVAKRQPEIDGVLDFNAIADINPILAAIDVGEVWGIGRNLRTKLKALGIKTVLPLKAADEKLLKKKFGILVLRTVMELRGVACFPMEHVAARDCFPLLWALGDRASGYQRGGSYVHDPPRRKAAG